MKKILLTFLSFFSLSLFSLLSAAVWEDHEQWSLEHEKKFSEWMESDNVHEYMFVNPGSRYYGINADCADAAYALRAIYAFENNLPFAIVNPSGSRDGISTLNNRLSNWDRFSEGMPRLKAMINEIAVSVGTDNLAYMDTYPVAIKGIRPGTVYITKVNVADDYFIKHTFNIKKINEVGTFDVLYSSESIQATGAPMQRRKDKEMDVLPSDPYGYRQFRWPSHLGVKIKSLPEEMQASFEQFIMARTMDARQFMTVVKKMIGTIEETDNQKLQRTLNTLCMEAQTRVTVVQQAQLRLQEINGQCMDFRDFDTYSTPARDASLKEAFFTLQKYYFEMKEREILDTLDPQTVEFSEIILVDRERSDQSLLKWCPVTYKEGTSIDLADLWKRLYFEKLSSHPNDSLEIRWGEEGVRTSCKRWY